ncbi:MAG: hypothetical protein RR262_18080 [Clostridium sp.]
MLNFIVLPSLKEIFMLLYPLTLINFIIDLFFSCALIGIIYFDIDCISAILKRQYLEVTNEYVKVKSLFRTKIINWTDVEIVGEMESYPNNILFGIIVWKYGEEGLKSILYGNSLVIDFNKYSQLDKYEFCDAMQRKRRNSYRKRF